MQTTARTPQRQIVLRNRFTNDLVAGLLMDTQEIDGKPFFVINQNGRTMKLAKDGYTIVQQGR